MRCKLDGLSSSNPNLGVTAAAFDLHLICKLKHRTGAYCLPLTKIIHMILFGTGDFIKRLKKKEAISKYVFCSFLEARRNDFVCEKSKLR